MDQELPPHQKQTLSSWFRQKFNNDNNDNDNSNKHHHRHHHHTVSNAGTAWATRAATATVSSPSTRHETQQRRRPKPYATYSATQSASKVRQSSRFNPMANRRRHLPSKRQRQEQQQRQEQHHHQKLTRKILCFQPSSANNLPQANTHKTGNIFNL